MLKRKKVVDYLNYLKKKQNSKSLIIVIGMLVVSVPILLSYNLSRLNLVIGVVVLLAAIFLFYKALSNFNSAKVNRLIIKLTKNDKYWLNENIPFYRSLSASDKRVFENRVGLFLGEIQITEVGKEIAEKSTCLFVASSAIITYWGLPYWNYGELSEVLVYPENFNQEKEIAEHYNIQGQVFHGGLMNNTMILSRSSLIKGFRNAKDGMNVGVHEFTHLLDKSDGIIDGLPVGLNKEEREIWSNVTTKTLNSANFNLNEYARTNNSEFFAVAFELYRENPERLKRWHPELHAILSNYTNKSVAI